MGKSLNEYVSEKYPASSFSPPYSSLRLTTEDIEYVIYHIKAITYFWVCPKW